MQQSVSCLPDHSNIDLHSHSTRSDGTLWPTALVQRARANGVDMLGLTDHDVLDGLPEAQAAAQTEDLPTISLSGSRPRPSSSFIAARASAPA